MLIDRLRDQMQFAESLGYDGFCMTEQRMQVEGIESTTNPLMWDYFVAVREWIAAVGAKTASIAPGSPWENGYIESFNARLREELLDGEIFYSLKEAQIVIESWRRHYNAVRPHESLGYRPPAPEVFVPALAAWPSARLGSAPTATLPPPSRPGLN